MKCVKCGGEDVTVEMLQTGGKTRKSGVGLGGHTNNAARGITAISTLGMSNLVWKKSTGTGKTTFKTQKTALCQSCGHDWAIR
ncbi:hypothetical protein SA2016_0310 [Sinomonas atrocyanea]|uniref:Uncharacterized protein n=1 Tax=Sinomonas atrocyanea TaxID=37927 RepID=A0A126ZWU5_9MICC|nr:hypothetical protein [Sinomonas atrocyanea]AMM31011.1 hypothetical protein SA2016_0310 [Sinomonas atrocyanea]GEB63255.1 hypothetical protein SAT01_07030 [Sinomonas atrocyanea]GGG69628.1 hypothetical protein GCM10007172_22220 [Sinomonas atrocyanea]